ncbi:MAG: S46 family peptidase [Gemmataceae bacterium]|nr:S46 family peptidase [Gemmataceae bacterium]
MKLFLCALPLAALALVVLAPRTPADEGLWLFNNPPRKLLQEKYNFEPEPAWFEHVQKASVRFNSGGSGSFVSPDGLVMTNHHVGLETLQKLSSKEKDYVKDGFLAKTRDDEPKAVDLELNVLMEIIDVTDQVKQAVDPKLSPEKAQEARQAIIARIEKESEEKTRLRSNVITLYQGNQYHLYRFKRYTDVRLVFAPEQQIAFFGGDPDNFAYPRYDLDVCFFRVYENDKPAKVEHYLKWSKAGARDTELVFVSGHPGHTDRLNTVAELEYLRDSGYPYLLQRLYRWEVMLGIYSAYGEENARKAKDFLFSVANSRKAREGGLAGLLDPSVMAQKIAYEKKLRAAAAEKPELKDAVKAWDTIAKVQKTRAANIKKYVVLEQGSAFNTPLFGYARTLVRAADEYAKPNEKRLPEYSESNKKPLELRLFSRRPLYPDYEQWKLADSLTWLCEQLGTQNKLVKQILAGKSPRERAAELIGGTRLFDVKARKALYEGGKESIKTSADPLIKLAVLVDKEARAVRKIMDTQVEEVKRQAYDQVARVKFAVEGTDTYPDATFTLRLSLGTVKGYVEDGKKVPFETTYAGLYEKAKEKNNKHPFDLPQRWIDRKGKLDLKVPFNFVCTTDIIGGNSGSPVINRKGEVVGLIFDGNIQSLVWDFVYTEEQARAVAVHSQGITEALRAVYDATALADELTGARSGGNR